MSDTTAVVAQRQVEIYRQLGGAARLRLAFEMSEMAMDLARARLRTEHPDWGHDAVNRELLRYSLLARRVSRRAE